MKTVSAALAAALNKRVWRPVVNVTVDDRRNGGVSPTVWSQWYDGTEVNIAHGAFVGVGAYVLDFRVNALSQELYVRRDAGQRKPGLERLDPAGLGCAC